MVAASGQMLRHSPGATKNRIGSSGTITWKKTNSPAAGRTNIMTITRVARRCCRRGSPARHATAPSSAARCRRGNSSRSPVGSMPSTRSASVIDARAVWRARVAEAVGRRRPCARVASNRVPAQHGRFDGRRVQHDDLRTPEPQNITGHERRPPGQGDAVDRGPVAASEVDHRQRGRARHQPQVLARHSVVGQDSPGQSRPTTIGRLSTRRRAGRPHSRISISGGPATSDLLEQQTASAVSLQWLILDSVCESLEKCLSTEQLPLG